MYIEEPGCDRAPAEINAPSSRRGKALNLGVRANSDNAITRDRHGLGDAIGCVHREHPPIDENKVGARRLRDE